MQLKRIFTSLLVAIMVLSMAVIGVSADATTTFDVAVESTSTALEVGSNIEVNVVIKNNPGAEAIKVVVEYDAATFELVGVTTTSDIYSFSDSALGLDGVIKAEGAVTLNSDLNTENGVVAKVGTIATITLKVKAAQTACEIVKVSTVKAYASSTVKLETTGNALSFHKLGEPQTTAATCTEAGKTVTACANCDYTVTEEIPATGHTEEVIPAVSATCTTDGSTEGKKCSACGEILVGTTVVEKTGHTEEVIPATDTHTEGKKCSVCGETLVAPEEIQAPVVEEPASLTWLWIVIAVVAVIGVAAVVVIVIKKKK